MKNGFQILALDGGGIKGLFKDFPKSHCTIRRNALTWNVDLTSSDLSNTYTIFSFLSRTTPLVSGSKH